MLRVATWNVLHRVHAENWGEDHVVATFPDERIRVATIARAVAALLGDHDAVALQEVSGDQFVALRAACPGASLAAFAYPRVPRSLRPGGTILDDPREFLVVASPVAAAVVYAEVAAADDGKGLVAVRLGSGAVVVNTHVAGKDRGPAQARRVCAYARERGAAALVGDFNMERDRLAEHAGDLAIAAPLAGPPTRQSAPSLPGKNIDHGLSATGTISVAGVLPGVYASDHRAVSFRVVPRPATPGAPSS